MGACMEVDGGVGESRGNIIYIYIYQKGYQHGQAIQLLSVIMLHDLCVTVCVCSEGSALFHINVLKWLLIQIQNKCRCRIRWKRSFIVTQQQTILLLIYYK